MSDDIPIGRAEINKIGSGWDQTAGPVAERHDSTNYLPLHSLDGFLPHPSPVEPPPPPPTEEELRQKLADTIAAKAKAEAAMQQAREGHERSLRNVQRCRNAVAQHIGLDQAIDSYTIEALRGGDGRCELPDALRSKLHEREVASVELASAERAAALLLREMSDATTRLQRAEGALAGATWAMLDVAKAKLQEPLAAAQRRVAAIEQACRAGPSFALWKPIVAALHDDPLNAPLDVAVPEQPEEIVAPPVYTPPVYGQPQLIKLAKPVGTDPDAPDVFTTLQEISAERRAANPPTTDAVEQFKAVERAQRLARGI